MEAADVRYQPVRLMAEAYRPQPEDSASENQAFEGMRMKR
jgi:hypothetical protein